jgi:hypothetical protein
MKYEKKPVLFEQLRRIKYRTDYIINETPKYRSLVNDSDIYDDVPMTNEAGDQEEAPKPEGSVPPAPSNDQPVGMDAPEGTAPDTGAEETGAPPLEPGMPPPGTGADLGMPPAEPPEQQVNDIQNDIIKHNIEAMKSIHDKLQNLDMTVQDLNSKIDTLNADVEEVREPTNTEKLMNKKNVSYPYYFNLNDFWSGNWFSENREKENEKGMKEMPDGSYVADFDDLPQKSKIDIQDSFNDIS